MDGEKTFASVIPCRCVLWDNRSNKMSFFRWKVGSVQRPDYLEVLTFSTLHHHSGLHICCRMD